MKKIAKAGDIVRAALEQFAQRGFAATSLESIAAEAGIGKSTIYEYYKNKEELFVAAVRNAVDQWFEDIAEIAVETQDPIERLERIAYGFIECEDTPPSGFYRFHFEILMQTVMEGGVFFERKHEIQQIHQKAIDAVADILLEGVSTGHIRPGAARNARKIAVTYLSFLDGISLGGLVADAYIDVREHISFFIETLTPMLRNPGESTGNG